MIWFALVLSGCTDLSSDPATMDPLAASRRFDADTWYQLAYDPRDCAWPMCGGWFIDPVNRRWMTCGDGSVAERCYVADLDTAGLFATRQDAAAFDVALGEGRALVRGRQQYAHVAGHDVVVLDASEAWAGLTGTAPSGRFVLVTQTPLACFAEPCANLRETPLNSRRETMIAELDFAPSGATSAQIREATDALATGLIVAGRRYAVTGPGGTAPARTVTEAWVRLGGP